jgi:hypothetical protein
VISRVSTSRSGSIRFAVVFKIAAAIAAHSMLPSTRAHLQRERATAAKLSFKPFFVSDRVAGGFLDRFVAAAWRMP